MHSGQSLQGPNPASTRPLRLGHGNLVFPGSPASGPIHFRLETVAAKEPQGARAALGVCVWAGGTHFYRPWEGWARAPAPAFTLPLPLLPVGPALPRGGVLPVLTLAAEPK